MGREIEPTLTIWSTWSLVPFRDIGFNDLTELPPGIFDSLALLEELYVLSLVVETSFVSCLPCPAWYFGLAPLFTLAQQDIARWSLCLIDELEQLIFLNLAMQLSSWASSSQSSGSGGQWGLRLSQSQLFDRFHLLLLSEISITTAWQSCRPASSTRWLFWLCCTYFRLLRRHPLFPPSLSLVLWSCFFARLGPARYS